MKHCALFLLVGAAAAINLDAQSGMGTTPTTGSGGQTSVQANPNIGAHNPDTARPINITGKVVIEDASAVAQNITIERVCSGMSRTVAYTDAKGRFSFQWGDRNALVADAADAGSGSRTAGFGSAPPVARAPGRRSVRKPHDELRTARRHGGLPV